MIRIDLCKFGGGSSGSGGLGADGGPKATKKQEFHGSAGSSGVGFSAGVPAKVSASPAVSSSKSTKSEYLKNTEINRNETYELYISSHGIYTYSHEVTGTILISGDEYHYDKENDVWRDSQNKKYRIKRK